MGMRTYDAEDAIADAVVESIANDDTVLLPWSRDFLDAIEARPDFTLYAPRGACEGIASGIDEDGNAWVLYLYNGAEG